MYRPVPIAVCLLAATLAGAADPATPEIPPARVETPMRYDNRVRMHQVPLNFKTPEEIRRDEEKARIQPDPRTRKEIFADEPVQAPPMPQTPQQRPKLDEKRKDDNWLKTGDPEADAKKRDPSGWGWLVDDSRRVAELRDQREKGPERPDEDEPGKISSTNSALRGDQSWVSGENRDPSMRATDNSLPGRDGQLFADRKPDLPGPGERSRRVPQPEDLAMERELSRRATWLPAAGFNSAASAAQAAPSLFPATRDGSSASLDANAGISALRPAGATALEPLAGFTPTRIGNSISAPTDLSAFGAGKPLFTLPGLNVADSGAALPSLTPSLSTPARDLRGSDQKPPMEGIRANTLPW